MVSVSYKFALFQTHCYTESLHIEKADIGKDHMTLIVYRTYPKAVNHLQKLYEKGVLKNVAKFAGT